MTLRAPIQAKSAQLERRELSAGPRRAGQPSLTSVATLGNHRCRVRCIMPGKCSGRRLSAALLLPILLLSGATQGGQFFRCRFDQTVRSSCCCRGEGHGRTQAISTIAATGCCDAHSLSLEKAPYAATHTIVMAPASLQASPAVMLEFAEPLLASAVSLTSPRNGVRLVLLHCSLLV